MNSIIVNVDSMKTKINELDNLRRYYSEKKNVFGRGAFDSSSSLADYLGKIQTIYQSIGDNMKSIHEFLDDYVNDVEGVENQSSEQDTHIISYNVSSRVSQYKNSLKDCIVDNSLPFKISNVSLNGNQTNVTSKNSTFAEGLKTALATGAVGVASLIEGIANVVEVVGDVGSTVASKVTSLLGLNNASKALSDFVSKDWSQDVYHSVLAASGVDKYVDVDGTMAKVLQGAGNVLGAAGLIYLTLGAASSILGGATASGSTAALSSGVSSTGLSTAGSVSSSLAVAGNAGILASSSSSLFGTPLGLLGGSVAGGSSFLKLVTSAAKGAAIGLVGRKLLDSMEFYSNLKTEDVARKYYETASGGNARDDVTSMIDLSKNDNRVYSESELPKDSVQKGSSDSIDVSKYYAELNKGNSTYANNSTGLDGSSKGSENNSASFGSVSRPVTNTIGKVESSVVTPDKVTNTGTGAIAEGTLEKVGEMAGVTNTGEMDTIVKDTNLSLDGVKSAMAFLSLARENMGKDVNGYWDAGLKCMESDKNAMKAAEELYEKERETQEKQVTDYINALYEAQSRDRLRELVVSAQNSEEVRRYLDKMGINVLGAENKLDDKDLITKIIVGSHAVNRQIQLKNEVVANNSEYRKYSILSKMLSSVIQNVGPINTGRGEVIYLTGRDNSFWSGLAEEDAANQAYKDLVLNYAEAKANGFDDILKLFSGLIGSEAVAKLENDYKSVQVSDTVINGNIDNLGTTGNDNKGDIPAKVDAGVSGENTLDIARLLKQVILDRNNNPEAVQAYYQAIRDCMKVESDALTKAQEWYLTVNEADSKYISDYVQALYGEFDNGGKERLIELINAAKGSEEVKSYLIKQGINVSDALSKLDDKEYITSIIIAQNALGRITNYKNDNLSSSTDYDKSQLLEGMISSTIQYKGKLDLGTGEFLELNAGRDNAYWGSVSESEAYQTAYKDLVNSYFVAKQKGYEDVLKKYESIFGANIIKSLDADYNSMISQGVSAVSLDYLVSKLPMVENHGSHLGNSFDNKFNEADKIDNLDNADSDSPENATSEVNKDEIYAKIEEVNDFVYMLDNIGYANLKDEDFLKIDKYIDMIQDEKVRGILGGEIVNVYMKSLNRVKQIKDYQAFINKTLVPTYVNKFAPFISEENAVLASKTVEFCNSEEFAKLGFDSEVIGYNDGVKSYVNIEGNPTNINYTNISHELLHQLSYKEKVKVGEFTVDKQGLCLGTKYGGLSEVVTEYFNELVVGAYYPGEVYSGYQDAVKRLKELIKLGIVDDKMLIKGYFSDDTRNMDDLVNAFYRLDENDGWSIVTDLFDGAVSSDVAVRNDALAKLDGLIENWKLNNV